LHVTFDNLKRWFPDGVDSNIGVLNGRPSNNQVDADVDCEEAARVGLILLPRTGCIFGRRSRPRSHYLYVTDVEFQTAQEEYKDLDGTMLVELRGTGGMTVVPPGLHESGESIAWDVCGEPAAVPLERLRRAVRRLAACALIARHWPAKGSRDRAAMA